MDQETEFGYHNIQLNKSESLGNGSYGRVYKAKCDGLLCAAKIMHPTLFDVSDPKTVSKFQEECRLLSLARHPNVVQYLATHNDPDTRLPVLLMELCDESLTAFLEQSQGPLSYHVQLNICLDIALALVYLHSNDLIHRDLTGNNVLMIGTRAKITDFGMSKLITGNPCMTALTLCPGNSLYMSPEALDEATKSYTAKLDIFSFGVIVIQILTREFPNPTDRFRKADSSQFDEEVRLLVPETKRRQEHLQLISDTHSLKPLVLKCLMKETQRPSAVQLSERLSKLKQAPQYTESMHQAQTRVRNKTEDEIDALRRQVQELQQHNINMKEQNQQLELQVRDQMMLIEAKIEEASAHQAHRTHLQSIVETKDRHLQENQQIIKAKDRQLQEKQQTIASKQHAMATKERQLRQTQQQLQDSEQLLAQFQQSLQQRDETIKDLQQAISHHKRETDTAVAIAQKKVTWKEGKKAPETMRRGAAVVNGNTAYFTPYNTVKIYSYQNIQGKQEWCRLPDNPNGGFSLAVIDGLLTSVGGWNSHYVDTNTLFSLTGEGEKKQWSEVFHAMPTPRSLTACITTELAVVVTGGEAKGKDLATVEVMDINTKQWTTVCPLPQKLLSLSAIVCGDSLYLAGGITGSKSVFTYSLPDHWQTQTLGSRIRRTLTRSNVWKEIRSLPVTHSTLVSFEGHLLAIGGDKDSGSPTTDVYKYDSNNDSWHVIRQMKNKRSWCFAVTLPEERLIVVGGWRGMTSTDSVEILVDK